MSTLEMSKPPWQSKHEASLDPELGSKPREGKKSRCSLNLHRSFGGSSAASDLSNVSLAESDASVLGMIPPPKSQLYIARLLMSLLATALLWSGRLQTVRSLWLLC